MPDISFIIVNWNAKDFLNICLESIHKHSDGFSYEIIVVDNGSEDGSQELIRSRYPDVRFFDTGENLGFARANNYGMKKSLGRYICLVNSDIEFIENCISPLMQHMDNKQDTGIVGPKLLNTDLSTQNSIFPFPSICNTFVRAFAFDYLFRYILSFGGLVNRSDSNNSIKSVDALSGAFLIIRREAYEAVGGFDDDIFMYSEDIDISKRYRQAGWNIVYYPFTRAIHFGGGSSKKDPVRFYVEQQRAKLYFLKKYYHFSTRFFIKILMVLHHAVRLPFWLVHFFAYPVKREHSRQMIKRYYTTVLWLCSMIQL